ncbi:Fe(3+)-dicitrate ABC transporter substrate-binding protein FecB, partial [Pseudomonas syringae]|nr:Fe(3+)-dicitrate ABC transporter substrate-binding protein FecB [Pseudomonas syringae]
MRAFRLPHLVACGLLTLLATTAQAAPIDINDGQHNVHLPDTPQRVVVPEVSFFH